MQPWSQKQVSLCSFDTIQNRAHVVGQENDDVSADDDRLFRFIGHSGTSSIWHQYNLALQCKRGQFGTMII